jgi:hypothetical protein
MSYDLNKQQREENRESIFLKRYLRVDVLKTKRYEIKNLLICKWFQEYVSERERIFNRNR